MDARTSSVSVAADLEVADQAAGQPFEFVEFRSIDSTYGLWVNVQGGEVADGGPGSVYFAPREPCRLRHESPRGNGAWRVMAEAGQTVRVCAVSYTADDLGDED